MAHVMVNKKLIIFASLLFFIVSFLPALSKETNEEMVLIPAGEFLMGMMEQDALGIVWATPQRKIVLPAFQIDRYEITNEKYKVFVDATGHKAPFSERHESSYSWKGGKYRENFGNHPVVFVDWYDAETYCKWLGKRLPSEAEWEKAARGTDARKWPWGNIFDKHALNTRNLAVKMTMPVGSFPRGASPYGVMDMSGNVFEWTSSWYKGYVGTKHQHPDYGELFKVARGGDWDSAAYPYALSFNRSALLQNYKHRTIGFRCAKSVQSG